MKKRYFVFLLAGMIGLSGCGGAAIGEDAAADSAAMSGATYEEAKDYGWDYEDEEVYETEADASADESQEISEYGQKLIKTYSFGIETTDGEKTADLIKSKVSEYGGYIESSNISGGGQYSYYTVRIPEENAGDFLSDSESFGTKIYESEQQEDVTMDYYDTESHIEALKTQHERLLELMEEAESIDDIVALEERLSDVEYELSSYEQTLKIYDNRINYVTITIDVTEVENVSVVKDDSIGKRISKGFVTNAGILGGVIVDLTVALIAGLPYIAAIAVIGAIAFLVIGKIRKKRVKKGENNEDGRGDN